MNLADAIRQATKVAAIEMPTQPLVLEHKAEPVHVETQAQQSNEPQVPQASTEDFSEPMNTNNNEETQSPTSPNKQTVVKLELFLTPDQLSGLFRAVAAGQHTMLTARETAAYLRIPIHTVESMALEGDLPGFQIDGRWRFAKQAIDEWLMSQQPKKESA